MSLPNLLTVPRMTLLVALSLAAAGTGCQSTIGGQTLPSAYYLQDDVQYFPAGPEFKLTNQVEALQQYQQNQLETGADENPEGPAPGP